MMSAYSVAKPPTARHLQRSRLALLVLIPLLVFTIVPPLALFYPPSLLLLSSSSHAPSLVILTLTYDQAWEHKSIEHNCAVIAPTSHVYIIYTDDLSQAYCTHCQCVLFHKRNCPCPSSDAGVCDIKNPCEKLDFLIRAVEYHREFVFLDNDLLILKPDFLDRLAYRSQAHDFLATYGHAGVHDDYLYGRDFNSGLMFVRWKQGVDYGQMMRDMYEAGSKKDQSIISSFVQRTYDNWDTLSWKWHCRGLKKWDQDIPVEHCYTVHDRQEVEEVLQQLGKTRMKLGRRRGADKKL